MRNIILAGNYKTLPRSARVSFQSEFMLKGDGVDS